MEEAKEQREDQRELEISPGVFIYNPALLPREELKRLFLVRHAELAKMLHRLSPGRASAQHVLILGERGMGKTTLLIRLAHAIEEDSDLRQRWIAVRFDEEQYNIGELADLWLNCLEKIGEDSNDPEPLRIVDQLLEEYSGRELEEAAFLRLKQYSLRKDRRFLLLVDNLDIVLGRLDPDFEAHRLRDILLHEEWINLIGAATGPVKETYDYDNPFYQLFETVSLEPLTRKEAEELLQGLEKCFASGSGVARMLRDRRELLDVFHILMRGNVRTTTTLFLVIKEHPVADLGFLLGHLFDLHTSRYMERIESLPRQGQRVFDALARSWDPTTAEHIASDLRIERGSASGQLHRLVDRNFAQKVHLPQRSIGFQVRDRFFNLWYLMRSGRRQRRLLNSLIGFVELFYRDDGGEVSSYEELVRKLMRMGIVTIEQVEQAREEALKETEGLSKEQLGLFGVSPEVTVLVLCCNGHYRKAAEDARDRLRLGKGTAFFSVILCHALEKENNLPVALDVINDELAAHPNPWLELERARVRAARGDDVDDIEDDLVPLSKFEVLPPRQLAAAVVEMSQEGPEDFRRVLEGLLRRARKGAPKDMMVVLANCEIELSLGHRAKALANFQEAVSLSLDQDSSASRGPLLTSAMSLAASDLNGETRAVANEVLKIVEGSELREEWLPLRHALATVGGDSDRLQRLSPEMRQLTEIVIDRIREIGRRSANQEKGTEAA